MDINEAIMWVEHAQTSMQVNGDPYGAKMLGEAVKALRARLAEVEEQRDMLKRVLIFIRDECDWEPAQHELAGDERIGDVIRDALAKLEEKDGK
jgi:transposase-like protein